MQSYRVKIKYKVTNWREYNKALKDRYNVTFLINENVIEAWYAEDDPKRGAQFVYSDVAIETVLAFRILFCLPLRGACGFVESILSMMGLKIKCLTTPLCPVDVLAYSLGFKKLFANSALKDRSISR